MTSFGNRVLNGVIKLQQRQSRSGDSKLSRALRHGKADMKDEGHGEVMQHTPRNPAGLREKPALLNSFPDSGTDKDRSPLFPTNPDGHCQVGAGTAASTLLGHVPELLHPPCSVSFILETYSILFNYKTYKFKYLSNKNKEKALII